MGATETDAAVKATTTAPPVLACSGVTAGYGRLVVARDIDLAVAAGEIVAVLGPNGAGKTTLMHTIAGFLKPLAGHIEVRGTEVKSGSARRMNAAGVVLVPDTRALFTGLTTVENLNVAARQGGTSTAEIFDMFPALGSRAKVKAGMLSGGEQQMLAVARALVQAPKVLLIDEMSMGLAPIVVESMMPVLRQIADVAGAGIVLVEQHVRLALDVADTALVLVHGEVTLQGPAAELRSDAARLEAAYLGEVAEASSAAGVAEH
jgi:branched-chain amino acid transport system ATP-binding protein